MMLFCYPDKILRVKLELLEWTAKGKFPIGQGVKVEQKRTFFGKVDNEAVILLDLSYKQFGGIIVFTLV